MAEHSTRARDLRIVLGLERLEQARPRKAAPDPPGGAERLHEHGVIPSPNATVSPG